MTTHRQLKVEDALAYLDRVKAEYETQPHVYNRFLDIMKMFKASRLDTPGVVDRVLELFREKRQLIIGFNTFLPIGYKIEIVEDQPRLQFPQGMTGPQPQPSRATAASAQPERRRAPVEFDQAINYVTKIKRTFEDRPVTYRAFLEILHTYQKEQKSIKDVYEEVSRLFKDHPDLLAEFTVFLPDGKPSPPPMVRWRRAALLIGRLQILHRHAAERAYAPGGGGFLAARDEFEELAGSFTGSSASSDGMGPMEETPLDLDAEPAGQEQPVAGEAIASAETGSSVSLVSAIKGLPRRTLQDVLLSLAEDPEEQERIMRAVRAAGRPMTKRRGGKRKSKRCSHRSAVGGGSMSVGA